jgi:hypothetical protein
MKNKTRTEITKRGNRKVIRKHFPKSKSEQMLKELNKIEKIRILGNKSRLFRVPKIIHIRRNSADGIYYYDMEYHPEMIEIII